MRDKKLLFKKAFYSFVVGDCLGAPLEFYKDGFLPYTTEILDNTFLDQKKGTWTDDTSMTLGTMDALANGNTLDYVNTMNHLIQYLDGKYTVDNYVFDIGIGTDRALNYFKNKRPEPTICGSSSESNNGNGALMRMLPIPFTKEYEELDVESRFEMSKNFTTLTHGHEQSIVASFIYNELMRELIYFEHNDFNVLLEKVESIVTSVIENKNENYKVAYDKYTCMFEDSFERNYVIRGSGYVVDTLLFAIMTILSKPNLQEAMIHTANYGGDNDTVCAITSSIASLYYKDDKLKESWLPEVRKKEILEAYVDKFLETI